jgi:hypothetical protein
VSAVKYELGFYIPEDILHSHRRENLKSYNVSLRFHYAFFQSLLPAGMDSSTNKTNSVAFSPQANYTD